MPFSLVPPSGLIWWLLIGLVVLRRHRRLGLTIITASAILLYALSTPLMGGLLIGSLEAQPVATHAGEPGAIIILGADGERTPDPLVRAEPGPLSLQRLAGAAIVVREKNLPVLITGGKVGVGQPAVADLMADLFKSAFDLPVEWRETKADNTCENARFSAEMLRKAGITSALVVTHAWHMPRAVLAFQRAGFAIVPAPLHADTLEIRSVSDFLPHTAAWVRSFYALHEWVGLIAYRMGACQATSPTP